MVNAIELLRDRIEIALARLDGMQESAMRAIGGVRAVLE